MKVFWKYIRIFSAFLGACGICVILTLWIKEWPVVLALYGIHTHQEANGTLKKGNWGGIKRNPYTGVLSLVSQSCLTLCDPMDCSLSGSSVHGDSPGRHTGVGCHALLQGIFPTQELNPGLPHCRQILYCLSLQGSPTKVYVSPKEREGTVSRTTVCVAVGEGCFLQPNTHQPHSPPARSGLLSQPAFRGQRGLLNVPIQLPSVGQVRRVWRVWTGKWMNCRWVVASSDPC